jgi:hypothetical protein
MQRKNDRQHGTGGQPGAGNDQVAAMVSKHPAAVHDHSDIAIEEYQHSDVSSRYFRHLQTVLT